MKLIFALIISIFAVMPLEAKSDACLAKSKEHFNEKEYSQAETTLIKCLKADPKNSDALISLAGVEMILGKFNNAEQHFKQSLTLLGQKSPYRAYIYSRMGDIYMRRANLKEAKKYYQAALKYEPANINALVGAGICEEKSGDLKKAVDYYKKALAVDFTNIVSRERLIALEPDILTDDELLRTMKERNIIDPAAQNFSSEDKETLNKIITAEKGSGIEYLSQKYKGKIPSGFIVERDSNKVYVRKMLTITGYNELIRQLSSDAKNFLINKGVTPAQLFKARDASGKDIFNNAGNLTDAGLTAFTKMLRGEKSYYLPGEKLPATQKEIENKIKALLARGYYEASQSDFIYLLDVTKCKEEVLHDVFKSTAVDIGGGKRRFFLSTNDEVTKKAPPLTYGHLYTIVQDYHAQRKAARSNAPVYSNQFGLGNGRKLVLCTSDGSRINFSGLSD